MHYGRLKNALLQMDDLLIILAAAETPGGFLDLGLRDQVGTYWIAITRPGMPDSEPNFPRRDLDLIEFLIEWAAGVRNHAIAEIAEMDDRYPELANLEGSSLMPVDMLYRPRSRQNWLKRAYKWILRR
jgi:hypothetical protein